MKKHLYIIFSILITSANAQDFNPKTIALPDNPTAQDFSFLKDELKDVQVVMLGEKTHYDGNVFEMKVKMAQYLNKEMGFNAIAFESGIYDVYKASQEIAKGISAHEALKKSLFFFWSKTKKAKLLSDLISKNKMNIYGFDNQITGTYGRDDLINKLYEYCKKYKLKLNLNKTDFSLLMESISDGYFFDEADISYLEFENELQKLKIQIMNLNDEANEKHFYWTQIIKSILSYGKDAYQNIEVNSSFHCSKSDNIRDEQMADNLLAYLKRYPSRKVICWGANAHFVNDMSTVQSAILKEFKPMGSYIKKALKDKMYSLAAITAGDSINLTGSWEKTPIQKGSFEAYLRVKNKGLVFISTKQDEMKKAQQNRLFSPITFVPSRLDKIHDGYLYFNKVIPLSYLDKRDQEEKNVSKVVAEEPNTITGKFIDQDTKETIPFVQILIQGTTVGAMADTKGKYILPYTSSKQKVIISAMGYAEKIITISNLSKIISLKEESDVLDAVILFGKVSPYTVVENAIKNRKKNYATKGHNLSHYANINFKVNDTSFLNFEFVSKQYNRGVSKSYRPTQNIQEINWITKSRKLPKKIHQFLFDEVDVTKTNCSAFFSKRKFRKFSFEIEKVIPYQGEDV